MALNIISFRAEVPGRTQALSIVPDLRVGGAAVEGTGPFLGTGGKALKAVLSPGEGVERVRRIELLYSAWEAR